MAVPKTWQSKLSKPSFRGVPFFVDEARTEGGRRLSVIEFPLRDVPYVQDLGRKVQRYPVSAYVLINSRQATPDYFDARNALLAAIQAKGPGTLVHPYYGIKTVQVESFKLREARDEGGIAFFDIDFVESGGNSSPTSRVDTQSNVIGVAAALTAALKSAYQILFQVQIYAGFVQRAATAVLSALHGNFSGLLALGGGGNSAISAAMAVFNEAVQIGDTSANIINIMSAVFSTFATAAVTPVALTTTLGTGVILIPTTPFLPLVNFSRAQPIGEVPGLDPTFGLSAFATFGNDLPAVAVTTADTQAMANNQTAVVQGAQILAIGSIATIYAQTTFANTTVAKTALDNMISWIETQMDIAASLGQDQLYLALEQLLAAVVQDMTLRAVQLPSIVNYATKASLPSLTLSQRLYSDGTHDQELVALNDAPHPLFMRLSGEALTPA